MKLYSILKVCYEQTIYFTFIFKLYNKTIRNKHFSILKVLNTILCRLYMYMLYDILYDKLHYSNYIKKL